MTTREAAQKVTKLATMDERKMDIDETFTKDITTTSIAESAQNKYEQLQKRRHQQLQKSRARNLSDPIPSLSQGESVEAVLEGVNVSVTWITEQNKATCVPRPEFVTGFRRRVIQGALENQYNTTTL